MGCVWFFLGGGGCSALSYAPPLQVCDERLHSTGFSSVDYCCSVRHCLSAKTNLFLTHIHIVKVKSVEYERPVGTLPKPQTPKPISHDTF